MGEGPLEAINTSIKQEMKTTEPVLLKIGNYFLGEISSLKLNFAINFTDGGLQTVMSFLKHESECYGADWCRSRTHHIAEADSSVSQENLDSYTIATCSYWDQSLKLWDFHTQHQ